ncbi:DUF4132 domain-containing protein [Saccharopolyspora sp. MS10]|uniref:DUF4132 domain-containing protein n=1 Tax=Saccharopolyspora sp. MS10 TaxID=3385973 RepID=UPI0039A1BED8
MRDVDEDAGNVVGPDENSFTMPESWQLRLRPRWGGLPQYQHSPHGAALDSWDRRVALAAAQDWSDVDVDPELVAAARRYLDGQADPLGAAILAAVTDRGKVLYEEVADAWDLRHGQAFAARVAVELFGLDLRREDGELTRLAVLPEGGPAPGLWLRRGAADRVRTRLSMASAHEYREVVDALAEHRGGARSRIVVSYMVPAETDWLAECCADPGESGRQDRVVRAMLLESLRDEAQLRALLREGGAVAFDGTLHTTATIAEGVGPAVAALIAEVWRNRTPSRGDSAQLAEILVELPTDEAFELLASHADDKHARPALLDAIRRYPVRAARLLALRAAHGRGRNAHLLHQLLREHVLAHRELLRARWAELPSRAAEVVRGLLEPPAEASAEALPRLLVSPPWTEGRTGTPPLIVDGLTVGDEAEVRWLPGEREAWAAENPERWQRPSERPDVSDLRERLTELDPFHLVALFSDGPDAYRPLLAQWKPGYIWGIEEELRPVAARWEADALPPLLYAAKREPAVAGGLLLPFRQREVARLMADWLVRLKSVAATSRAWFSRHGPEAVALLVPDAAGPVGAARRAAEHALRTIAAASGSDVVLDAASVHGPEVVEVVRHLLSDEALELALPPVIPTPADWVNPRSLPPVLLRGRDSALPVRSVCHLLTMLAVSRPDAVYPGVDAAREACDPESLAEFAWALFEHWRLDGMPPANSWTLHALGWLGDDDTASRLAAVLREWPGEGAHKRAVEGLDVLAVLGSDAALAQLHGVARKVRFKGLRTRAEEKIEQVAVDRGLTAEQLADRLVPEFDLEADGTTAVDYGSRSFTAGFDEQLRPYVLDEDGKRRKDLPKPGAHDDPELAPAERKRFTALKRDVRNTAADQTRRLESAMVEGRTWTVDEFRQLFLAHVLLRRLARRLVWLRSPGEGPATAFRVAADGSFADVRDEEFALPGDASVRLAHPLHLGDDLAAWAERFDAHGIAQPFPQLGRVVHRLTEREAAGDRLPRFEKLTVPTAALLGLERHGWERDEPMFAGIQPHLAKRVGKNRWLVIGPSEGFRLGNIDPTVEQTLDFVGLADHPSSWGPSGDTPLSFTELDPVTTSELLAELAALAER